MCTLEFRNNTYQLDGLGFIKDFSTWDENFAEGMAKDVEIDEPLTEKHWAVMNQIRKTFFEYGRCPAVYQVCRNNELSMKDLRNLFPTGYLRGACKLAGISYRETAVSTVWLGSVPSGSGAVNPEKFYKVDLLGFLIDPDEWDEHYCIHKAQETKMFDKPLDKHWKIINFLRASYKKNKQVPTVFETCAANEVDIEELEKLFPDGYHRGAVKLAGLRAR